MVDAALYPRYAELRLAEALEESPIVLIQGPRQCGKTTLAQIVGSPRGLTAGAGLPAGEGAYSYVTFDDDIARSGAETDPMGFIAGLPERAALDEVQRVPGIFTALKLAVDRDRTPGRFLLTGSTNVLQTPNLAESLAGRMETVRLHPLAQCEFADRPDRPEARLEDGRFVGFLDALFEGGFETRRSEPLGADLHERIVDGGYPAALARRAGRRRASWYRDYVEAQMQRDVRDMSRIRTLEALPRLMRLAAVQTATLLNVSDLARSFELSLPTVRSYLELLERVFLLERLPPWHSNRLSRLIKTPKLHIGDTGLACALMGLNAAGLARDPQRRGALLETFVFQELRRQAAWYDAPLDFFHFRDKDKAEVDIVIERGGIQVAGVEVKAASTVSEGDFRGLRRLREASGAQFAAGVVLHDGEISTSFGDGLYAVPIRMLWEAAGVGR